MTAPRWTLLLLLLALPAARAQCPTGTFDLEAPAEGSLRLERRGGGLYELRRRADGATWSGVARLESGTLALALERDGLAARLFGAGRRDALDVVYRVQDDGSLRGELGPPGGPVRAVEIGRIDTRRLSRREYFDLLDQLPGFRRLAATRSLDALLELVERDDVPPAVDRAYAHDARTPGGGRVLLALDYTRGSGEEPTWGEALKAGPKRVVAAKLLTPMLTHFRDVDGVPILRGDVGFGGPFRDSHLTSPTTNQVGHLLCAVETGVRQGRYRGRPFGRWRFEACLRLATRVFGLQGVEPTIADWSRAGIIGHELIGDEDGSGFLGQMNAYGRLVAGGDPHGVRAAWDGAVAAVLRGDHAAAWRLVRAIARAGQVPETPADVEANRRDPAPRLARPGSARSGNSLPDLALSAYGFALGQRAMTEGFPTPAAARAELEAFLHARGAHAAAIEAACAATR